MTPEQLKAIKERCEAAICSECDGVGSLRDRPGYFVLCLCADGLSLEGEEMPSGQFVRDDRALVAEVERLRAALVKERADSHEAYEIVCGEREKLHAALKLERDCVDDYRHGHAVALERYEEPTDCRIYAGTDYRCDLCKELDARRAAEGGE